MVGRTRVVIADDHALVRDGTREFLDREDDIDVIGEAADGEAAVALTMELDPDVVIMDIGMPLLNGVEATRRIKQERPQTAVLVLTVHDEDAYVFAVLEAGAAGYLLKDVPADEVVRAVRAVRDGESVLHPAVTDKVLARFRGGGTAAPVEAFDLSDREHEVLRTAASGGSNKEVAAALGISPRTVQEHLRSVFRKLGAASRTEAVITALRLGLLELEDLP
jgi:DNA-binding NarL/FixJ family response regulator